MNSERKLTRARAARARAVSRVAEGMRGEDHPTVDYLVGGLTIDLGPGSNTPGPRTHIVGFTAALEQLGFGVRKIVASELPMMGRFARIRPSDYMSASRWRIAVADIVRVAAALWCGMCVWAKSSRERPVDIIYERMATLQSLASFHASKRSAIRVVESNGMLARETVSDRRAMSIAGRLAARLEARVLHRADLVVAVSEALRQEIIASHNVPAAKILVLPNGVENALVARDLGQCHDEIRIGFSGAVVAWQHLDRLVAAVADLITAHAFGGRKVVLEIVGGGPEVAVLRAQAAECGITEFVRFHGQLSHGQAVDVMSTWTIGFAGHARSSSATMYHSPLKLYEYAALGLVIVCTPSADAEALRASGTPTFLFEPSDGASLKKQIDSAVEFSASDTPAARRSRRQRIGAEHGWPARALDLVDILSALPR